MRIESINVRMVADEDPNPWYLLQEGFEDRNAEYNRGDFHFVGIYAEARVVLAGTIQTVKSGGLWGIESDSDSAYTREIADEELHGLRDILAEMGADADAVSEAIGLSTTV